MIKGLFSFLSIFLIVVFYYSQDFILQIPKGFPEPIIPTESELTVSRVELGKKLFFDNIMSRDSTLSCASCHMPEFAFTDRRTKGIGIRNQLVSRNTPTLTNIVYSDKFLLDGVNPSLETQIMVPIHEKNEFDFHILLIAERMKKDPEYILLSREAYDSEPTPYVITNSIAAFERTLLSGNSSFDKYNFQEQEEALSASAKRGLSLFEDKLYCSQCHSGFNFTNYALENNGLYLNYQDSGRFRMTGVDKDLSLFKVPTLRNIAVTYPYMHDGSIDNLEDVIKHYESGGMNHINKSRIIKPFSLSLQEREDLIAFLNSLTDSIFLSRQY